MTEYEFHEIAELFPMLSEEELQAQADDIKNNGLIHPILLFEGKILDGRNRYVACGMANVVARFDRFDGTFSEAMARVWSENIHRRDLTSSQRAAIAVSREDIVDRIEAEAKEVYIKNVGRPRVTNDDKSIIKSEEMFPPIIVDKSKGSTIRLKQSRDVIAKTADTNPRYVSDVKKIKKESPKVFEMVKSGDVSIAEGNKITKLEPTTQVKVIEAIETGIPTKKAIKITKDKIAHDISQKVETSTQNDNHTHHIKAEINTWYRLGNQLLFCGDSADNEFINKCENAALSFADPPYNAMAADWDNKFVWKHDWLIDKSVVVAITPGIGSLQTFFTSTAMPYKWSVACWIDNGMTRGAMGFGNWIYVALFSNNSIHCNSQDFIRVSIRSDELDRSEHKGRKPTELITWIIDKFTKESDIIIDPFGGSGTTLLVSEQMKRKCVCAEIVPEFCDDIITSWEKMTKQIVVEI